MEVWHVYLVTAIGGIGHAFQRPAYMAAITTMIPKKHYGRAQGMVGMVSSSTAIVAPIAAGVLLGGIGIRGIMLVDLATFAFAVSMLLVVCVPQPASSGQGGSVQRSLRHESALGLRFLFERRPLLHLVLWLAAFNLLLTFAFSLRSPLILARTGGDEVIMGAVQTFLGLGGVAGGAVLSVWAGRKGERGASPSASSRRCFSGQRFSASGLIWRRGQPVRSASCSSHSSPAARAPSFCSRRPRTASRGASSRFAACSVRSG